MKRNTSLIITILLVAVAGLFILTGCGDAQGQNLADYMQDQSDLRASIDAQLSILSPEAKGSVKYTEDNTAEVEVQYYSLTDAEIKALEPDKAQIRCESILGPALEQFEQDTGNKAEIVVTVIGHKAE